MTKIGKRTHLKYLCAEGRQLLRNADAVIDVIIIEDGSST